MHVFLRGERGIGEFPKTNSISAQQKLLNARKLWKKIKKSFPPFRSYCIFDGKKIISHSLHVLPTKRKHAPIN